MTDVLVPSQLEVAPTSTEAVGKLVVSQVIAEDSPHAQPIGLEKVIDPKTESLITYDGINAAVDRVLGTDDEGTVLQYGAIETTAGEGDNKGKYRVERWYEPEYDADRIRLSFTPDDPDAPRQELTASGPMDIMSPFFVLATKDPKHPTLRDEVWFGADFTSPDPQNLAICKSFAFNKVLPALQ